MNRRRMSPAPPGPYPQVGTVSFSMDMPKVGAALTATLSDPDGGVTGTTWQWSRSDTMDGEFMDIDAATMMAYTPVDDDVDKYLKAMASYTDTHRPNRTAEAMTANAVGSAHHDRQRLGRPLRLGRKRRQRGRPARHTGDVECGARLLRTRVHHYRVANAGASPDLFCELNRPGNLSERTKETEKRSPFAKGVTGSANIILTDQPQHTGHQVPSFRPTPSFRRRPESRGGPFRHSGVGRTPAMRP